jgi:hypothetical protein
MKKPTPNVAVVSNSEAYWLSAGKNRRAMIKETENDEVVPFERVADHGGDDLERLRST